MVLNMPTPWKHPKTGVYWLRRRVPDHLQTLVGRTEIRNSLGTKDPSEAKRKFAVALSDLDAKWANLLAGPKPLSEIEALEYARPFYQELFAAFSANPSAQDRWDTEIGATCFATKPASRAASDLVSFSDADIRRRLQEQRCEDLATGYLASQGVVTDNPSVRLVAMSIARAFQTAAVDLQALARGVLRSQQSVSNHVVPRPVEQSLSLSQSDLTSGWKTEKRPTAKTEYAFVRVLGELMTFVGHDDVARVATSDIASWKANLLGRGLAAKTVRDSKLAPVRALFQWGVDNAKLTVNPAARLGITLKQKAGEGRRGYNDEEAVIVLGAAAKEKRGFKRWVPLLCAYSGARISEVCQLRRQDIRQVQGVWCMCLEADAGSLKNAGSERVVPLHPTVIEAGFLKFVEGRSEGPLFDDLTPDRFGSRGGNGTKLISRWVRNLGITDPRISPSHSWRHRLKTLGRRHGVSSDMSDAITGHAPKSVGDGYGEFEPAALLRELAKLP